MTDTIHGYLILDSIVIPKRDNSKAGRFVLVDRGERYRERYVVAWQGCEIDDNGCRQYDSEWAHGYYTESYKDASDHLLRKARIHRGDWKGLLV